MAYAFQTLNLAKASNRREKESVVVLPNSFEDRSRPPAKDGSPLFATIPESKTGLELFRESGVFPGTGNMEGAGFVATLNQCLPKSLFDPLEPFVGVLKRDPLVPLVIQWLYLCNVVLQTSRRPFSLSDVTSALHSSQPVHSALCDAMEPILTSGHEMRGKNNKGTFPTLGSAAAQYPAALAKQDGSDDPLLVLLIKFAVWSGLSEGDLQQARLRLEAILKDVDGNVHQTLFLACRLWDQYLGEKQGFYGFNRLRLPTSSFDFVSQILEVLKLLLGGRLFGVGVGGELEPVPFDTLAAAISVLKQTIDCLEGVCKHQHRCCGGGDLSGAAVADEPSGGFDGGGGGFDGGGGAVTSLFGFLPIESPSQTPINTPLNPIFASPTTTPSTLSACCSISHHTVSEKLDNAEALLADFYRETRESTAALLNYVDVMVKISLLQQEASDAQKQNRTFFRLYQMWKHGLSAEDNPDSLDSFLSFLRYVNDERIAVGDLSSPQVIAKCVALGLSTAQLEIISNAHWVIKVRAAGLGGGLVYFDVGAFPFLSFAFSSSTSLSCGPRCRADFSAGYRVPPLWSERTVCDQALDLFWTGSHSMERPML